MMYWIYQVLYFLGGGLRMMIGMVVPIFSEAQDLRSQARWVRRLLHIVFLIAILIFLGWLNYYLKVDQGLSGVNLGSATTIFKKYLYLPLLFFLTYVMCWLGWWVYVLLLTPDDVADFPDIDEAWEEALRGLSARGINISDFPLYLVLGQPSNGCDAFFSASQAQMVGPIPARADAPVRVWFCSDRNREAIFVSCNDISQSDRYARMLSGMIDASADAADGGAAAGDQLDKTITFDENDQVHAEIKRILALRAAEKRDLTPEEQERLKFLTQQQPANQPKKRLQLSPEAVKIYTRRLQFFCRLLKRDRAPLCPANGIIVLLPWACTDSQENTNETSLNTQRDLQTIRDSLALMCPVFAVFCDFEKVRGAKEYIAGLSENERHQRLGQRLPLSPALLPEDIPLLGKELGQWIGQTLFPSWIYRILSINPQAEAADPKATHASIKENSNLYSLMREAHLRHERISGILRSGFFNRSKSSEPPLFGGCYIAATGVAPHEQAFVRGLFGRFRDEQSRLFWTTEAFVEDKRYRSLRTMALLASFVTFIAVGGLIYYLTQK